MVDRKQPYTEIGIRRCKCFRCGAPARFQWQVCADGNTYRAVCGACDVALNEVVLTWMRHPKAEELCRKYAEMRGVTK